MIATHCRSDCSIEDEASSTDYANKPGGRQLLPTAVGMLRLLLSVTCSISEKDVQSKAWLSTTKGTDSHTPNK